MQSSIPQARGKAAWEEAEGGRQGKARTMGNTRQLA